MAYVRPSEEAEGWSIKAKKPTAPFAFASAEVDDSIFISAISPDGVIITMLPFLSLWTYKILKTFHYNLERNTTQNEREGDRNISIFWCFFSLTFEEHQSELGCLGCLQWEKTLSLFSPTKRREGRKMRVRKPHIWELKVPQPKRILHSKLSLLPLSISLTLSHTHLFRKDNFFIGKQGRAWLSPVRIGSER